jgi:hypothetical protein
VPLNVTALHPVSRKKEFKRCFWLPFCILARDRTGFGDAIGVAALGDNAPARVIAPGFPARSVALQVYKTFKEKRKVQESDVRPFGSNIGHPEQRLTQNPDETTATRQLLFFH